MFSSELHANALHMRQFMTGGQTIVQHGHPAERLCNKVSRVSVFAVGIRSIIFSTRGPSGHQAGRLSRPDISEIKMDFYGSRRESGGSLSYQKVDIKTKERNGSANLLPATNRATVSRHITITGYEHDNPESCLRRWNMEITKMAAVCELVSAN